MENNFENKNPLFYKGLIFCFSVLYLLVAFISFWHCIAFCLVGNPMWISVMMSFAFEVGLAATLFSILTTDNKNTFVAWILMTFLTFVQVIGNVYSVFKYMIESGTNFYVYIQDSMLHWFVEDVSTKDIMSIIAIILGALLPIVALLMTSMVSNNLKIWLNRNKQDEIPLPPGAPIPDNEFSNQPENPNPESQEIIHENPDDIGLRHGDIGIDSETKKINEDVHQDFSSETNDYEQVEAPDSYDLGLDPVQIEEDGKSLAEVVQEQPVSSIFDSNETIDNNENGQPDTENPESIQTGETEEDGASEESGIIEADKDNHYIGPGMRITSSKLTSDLNNLPEKEEGESIIGKNDLPVEDNPNIVFDPTTGKYVNGETIKKTEEVDLNGPSVVDQTSPTDQGINPYNIDTKPLEEIVKNNLSTIVKKGPFTVFKP